MAKRSNADRFAADVQKILAEYAGSVRENVDEVTKAVARKGAQAVRRAAASAVGGTGEYARGWTSKVESGRFGSSGVIYNKKPGLPHLLEHGHANRNGGRTPGRPHIAAAAEQIVREFEEEVKSKL